MAKLRRIKYADLMSTIAAFIALGGVSYAAIKLPQNSVGGKQIRKGAVTSSDVKNGSLLRKDLKRGLLPSRLSGTDGGDGSDGSDGAMGTDGDVGPMGPPGPQGPQGLMGPEGPAGPAGTARAYAVINPASCGGGACTATRSKEIGNVSRVSTGRYCITAFGIDGDVVPAYASVEYSSTAAPQASASALVSTSTPECLDGQFLVVTKRMQTETVKNTSNVVVTVLSGSDTVSNDIGFSIVIP